MENNKHSNVIITGLQGCAFCVILKQKQGWLFYQHDRQYNYHNNSHNFTINHEETDARNNFRYLLHFNRIVVNQK